MKPFVLSLLFLSITISLTAQKTELLVNSGQAIEEGIKLHDDGKYKEAIKQYDLVFEGDTNYVLSIYEKALSLNTNKQYQETIDLAEEALNFKEDDYKFQFYNLLNTAYDGLEDAENALKIINEGLKEYPNSYLLHYNKGVTLTALKRFNESFESFKNSLSINPLHFNSHFSIGKLAANQSDYTKAFFALSTALMADPNHTNTFNALILLDEVLNLANKQTEDIANLGKDDFSDINDIIESKVAIDDKYKTDSNIDFDFVNQMHALIEMLQEDSGNGGWFAKTYLPYFYAIKKENQFKPFSEYACLSSGSEKIQKKLSKNIKALKEFEAWSKQKFETLYGTIEKDGKKLNRTFHDNYTTSGIGLLEDEKEIGFWQYFYSNSGNIAAEGMNNKTGQQNEWIYYYSNGKIRKKLNFKDSKANGAYSYYSTDGILEITGEYKNDKENGLFTYYDIFGCKYVEKNYKDGILNGDYKEFYKSGQVSIEANFKDGLLDGAFKKYYEDGSIKEISTYKNGKFNANTIEYFNNGNKLGEYNYIDGVLNGAYKTYYETGELSYQANYVNGKESGISKGLYKNGKISSESNYDESGKKNGVQYYFDKNGNKTYEQVFKKGEVIEYKFLANDGKVLSEGKKKNDKFYVDNRLPDNTKTAEGNYAVGADGKDGLWKFYTEYGQLESEIEYENGEIKGLYKTYNTLGNLITETKIVNNNPYTEWIVHYYANGKISSNGWKVNNNFEGKWEFFHPNGNLASTKIWLQNQYNGPLYEYDIEGKLSHKYLYVYDDLVETLVYDTIGNVIQNLNYKNDKVIKFEEKDNFGNKAATFSSLGDELTDEYKIYYGNGKLYSEGHYKNGLRDGIWKYYTEDGQFFYESNYTYGKLTGKRTRYFAENGNVDTETNYENNVEEGNYISYHLNGKIDTKGKHENDKNIGTWEFYDPNGVLQMVRFYDDEGKVIGYSYNGTDGKLIDMIPLPPNGNATVEAKFANGKPSKTYNTKNNQFDGVFKEFYENGQVAEIANQKMGYLHGLNQTFLEDGTLLEEKNYDYNLLNGAWKKYYPNGKLKSVRNYVYDNLHGEVIYYNQQEEETLKRIYYNDNLIEEIKF